MSPKLPRISGQQLIRALKRAGYIQQRQRGSHVHLKRDSDGRRVIVPIHVGRDVPLGTLRAILRDADITPDQLIELL
jgi:predicted RNA binding protein YcfA (HicA-like mRNA interferase family)